jgi:hypothetical protein
MGWNCVVSVAENASLSDLRAAGAVVGDVTITGADATSSSHAGTTVLERPVGLVFLNTDLQLLDDLPRIRADLGGPVLTAFFHSVSDSWMWQVDRPGELRRLVWHAGEEAEDSGTPHPAEDVTAPLDEDTLSDLLGRATGVWFDHDLMWADVRPVTWPG